MENIKNHLFELCSESAPSGREDLMVSLERLVKPLVDKVYRDSANNLIAFKSCGIPGAPKLMLDAHADEVGLIVKAIDENGFIHFDNHAGIDAAILPSSTVTVLGSRALTGVVATLPPHLLKDASTEKTQKITDLVIDVGYDKATLSGIVNVGDLITLRSGCVELLNNLVMGKSFDNRASCALIIDLLTYLKHVPSRYDIYAVFSAAEEFGGYGARTAAFTIEPDEAIVFDVTFGQSPFANSEKGKKLGDGCAIGISPMLDSNMTEALIGAARTRNIAHSLEIMNGKTGTNADVIVTSRSGVATALVSIPLRYMHSAGEVVSLADIKSASRLILNYVELRGGAYNE